VEEGDLFLDKYNETEARATYQDVLKINPRHAAALLGLGRAAHFEGSPAALDDARKSLDTNPRYVPSLLFVARLALEREAYDEADGQIAQVLELNPASGEGRSLRAATRWLAGDSSALSQGPASPELYTTLADASGRNRRYREALGFAARAVALDSTSWRGLALLGINQLRLGQVTAARASLEKAFAGDPYDVWTKNTLDLLDNLDRYRGTATRRFRFVAAPKEAELLTLYAGPLAEEAYDSLAAHYGYRPETPVRVEMYDRHADFSVRTVGLVGLGALGVSFGPVVVMDAPSAREPGEFHWGSTLWHEISHTFHLGLSDSRVPRWFTEGLAVFEERRARPGWGDGVTPGFLKAFLQGRLVPVSQLNRGFTDPDYPEQLIYSYYEASLVCDLIAAQHGPGPFTQLLQQFGQGRSTAQAFASVLGLEPGAVDRRFDAYVRERFAGPLRGMDDFASLLEAGRTLLAAGRSDSAERVLLRARWLFPEYAGPDSPAWYLAQIYQRRGARAAAAAELDTLTLLNAGYYPALLSLAALRDSMGDKQAAARAYDRAMYVYPLDLTPHVRLAELAADLSWWPTAVRERRAVLALQPVDRAEALYQLALAYYHAGQASDARGTVLQALEMAPGFERAQELLLKIREGK
jgi:tetratricopeptide (TPR) repeat protein